MPAMGGYSIIIVLLSSNNLTLFSKVVLLDTNKHKIQTIMKEESISKFGTGITFFLQSYKLRSEMV